MKEKKITHTVPFGFEPSKTTGKGTLIYYDTFEHTSDAELDFAAQVAGKRAFVRLVLYPLHEETVRRMTKEPVRAYHKRVDQLHEWKHERSGGGAGIIIEGFEGKRKKYTPIDTALRHLTQTYPSPYFIYMSPETANLFASFESFEEWIVKLRLLLPMEPSVLHPKLAEYRGRWDVAAT
ncbi:hypothetical protein [Paenibacillus albus]|uniref:Uncharacterized protein n=1 Tax=Paenibacillus albus TaxID=2495582 RepID=A0A3Q8X4T7_9BACL|nr:hypothetical protein [Paenibacillus albus]AZN39280.1 hypothetical protein EJC50_06085 [Paenibacillus albus]